jgi:hypothetical protein
VQFVWLALGIIFLLPFLDPRRPLRLLHLDLLVLVGGAAAIMYPAYVPFGDASVDVAITSAHLGMAYLVVRMLMLGFRPGRRGRAGGPDRSSRSFRCGRWPPRSPRWLCSGSPTWSRPTLP